MNTKELVELYQRVIASLEGTISDEEYTLLMCTVRENKDAARYYTELLSIYTNLSCPAFAELIHEKEGEIEEQTDHQIETDRFDPGVWKALLETEKTAPTISEAKIVFAADAEKSEKNHRTIVKRLEHEKPDRKVSKSSLLLPVLSFAALLFIIVFLKFVPSVESVATLTDSINAKWITPGSPLKAGDRFETNTGTMVLAKGVVKISCDSGIKLLLEGPARFEFVTPMEIRLQQGSVFASVSDTGRGFTVTTQHARIIDLGTEFGVRASLSGSTELHVFKGKTILVAAGAQEGDKQALDVLAGQAERVDSVGSEVKTIGLKQNFFVKEINSNLNMVWRGGNLSLANVVAGGNGFSGGDVEQGIDLSTGSIHAQSNQGYMNAVHFGYSLVPDSDFVDGVFVPNGARGLNVVSSEGHQYGGFPKTTGSYWTDITANPYVIERVQGEKTLPNEKEKYMSTLLDIEEQSGDGIPPRLLLHPNAGITFDLRKIRHVFSDSELIFFRAICGLPQTLGWKEQSEFWVLVDGQPVFYHQIDSQNPESKAIEVPLHPSDQFLTLVATDGGDNIHYDWCVFAKPEIEIVQSK